MLGEMVDSVFVGVIYVLIRRVDPILAVKVLSLVIILLQDLSNRWFIIMSRSYTHSLMIIMHLIH